MLAYKFINQIAENLSSADKQLMIDFFIIFSRFECALKVSSFHSVKHNGTVSPNWDQFVSSIQPAFNKNISTELSEAVAYILTHPPKIQVYDGTSLLWIDRPFTPSDPEITRLNLSIRDLRNNLFHGGKFNGNYVEDISRNSYLFKYAIVILNNWLSLNPSVRSNYIEPIS